MAGSVLRRRPSVPEHLHEVRTPSTHARVHLWTSDLAPQGFLIAHWSPLSPLALAQRRETCSAIYGDFGLRAPSFKGNKVRLTYDAVR